MQDQVSIGKGRSARRVFGLDQVDIVPSRRTRSSHDVDTTWKIDAYRFDIPVMSHPSDAVVTPEFAIEFGKLGGLPVINAEGLWGRQADLEGALEKVRTAAGGDDPLGVPEPDCSPSGSPRSETPVSPSECASPRSMPVSWPRP